jgi:hypothetical protein
LAEAAPVSRKSSMWLCTDWAPALMQASASATISSGVIGAFGLRDFLQAPFSAASMTTGLLKAPSSLPGRRQTTGIL